MNNRYYIIRLDDACEKMNTENWERMEVLLDKHGITPIVGIIPDCKDPDMDKYPFDFDFWQKTKEWEEKGWVLAMHGYNHVFSSSKGGVNPVNNYSEFAEEPLDTQKEKISAGYTLMKEKGIIPQIFIAPAHTFDKNTVTALKECTDIRIISDTIANDIYEDDGITYIPQQSGHVRKLPFKTVTFCYHPNLMEEEDFDKLSEFIKNNKASFDNFNFDVILSAKHGKMTAVDSLLKFLYFIRRKL